ncbi:MAG: hypothetical protein OXL97_06875 [Chloroflexota bacterium]|nr:hypothetical protein [Chloroflexota bacterium]
MKTRDVRRGRRLTKEQEELRQRGLRLLARIIARRHLASLAQDNGVRSSAHAADLSGSIPLPASGAEPPAMEDEHAR